MSQLGRVILDFSKGSSDEASERTDAHGRYAPIDGLLRELADRLRVESVSSDDRRPDDVA